MGDGRSLIILRSPLALIGGLYRFTFSNGYYALFESVFSSRIAVPLMLLCTISSVFGVATIAAGIGQYIGFFDLTPVLMIEIAIMAAFCVLNIAGITFSGMTETILTALKIIPLVVISLLLLPFVRPENFVQSVPLTMTGLLATVMIVYWPFTGFEISAIPVEEISDPAGDTGSSDRCQLWGKHPAPPCLVPFRSARHDFRHHDPDPVHLLLPAAWILVAERKLRLVAAGGVLSTAAILVMYFTL